MNFKGTETATPSHVSVIVVSPEVTPGFMEIRPSGSTVATSGLELTNAGVWYGL